MSDLFKETVAKSVDPSLRRTESDGSPVASSGVSSAGSKHSAEPSPVSVLPGDKGPFPCDVCKKILKTKKGFTNHTFLHHIAEVNGRKPDPSTILEHVYPIIIKICDEMILEPEIPDGKKQLIEDLKYKALISPHWPSVQKKISEPIISTILQRKKVLPSNQYEEDLVFVNKLLNNKEFMDSLSDKVHFLCSADDKTAIYIPHVLFRVLSRLCEEIQIIVLKEMRSSTNSSPECPEAFLNAEEEVAFEDSMSSLFRTYYKKASSLATPVWEARSLCMRRTFVLGAEDDEILTSSLIIQKSSWEDKSVKLSDSAKKYFAELELIRSIIKQTTTLTADNVLEMLFSTPNVSFLSQWYSLTAGFLSESDALLFLRDVNLLVVNLSLRMHEKWVSTQEQEKRKLPKFALRPGLKHN